MTKTNFMNALKLKESEESQNLFLAQLKDSAQKAGVCDWRIGHGREVYFDF